MLVTFRWYQLEQKQFPHRTVTEKKRERERDAIKPQVHAVGSGAALALRHSMSHQQFSSSSQQRRQ